MVEHELSYDALASRLRGIGPAAIDYTRLGNRRRRVGALELCFAMGGSRLTTISKSRIEYENH